MTITSNKITEHKKPICLDLGAGHNPVSLSSHLVITVDSRPDYNPTVLTDLRKLPFDDCSVDAVYSSHVLEHFAFQEIIPVLIEWCRVLKVGGDFWFQLPNIEYACKRILEGHYEWNEFAILYGEQTYPLNFHKMGFTPSMLTKFIQQIICLKGDIADTGQELIYRGVKTNV
jgi:predicted SAM-dependent methyltransferase